MKPIEQDPTPPDPTLIRRRRPAPAAEEPPLRLPPHSHEAEQGVLGCLLLSPMDGIPQAEALLEPDAFYDLRHRRIYTAMLSLNIEGIPSDMVTLPQKLRDDHTLDEVGGLAYLTACMDGVPSAANLNYYLGIVSDKWMLRRLLAACTESISDAYDDTTSDVADIVDRAERAILAVRISRARRTPSTRELVIGAVNEIEEWTKLKGAIAGIPTGFPDLDYMLDGLHPGEVTVLSGFPGSGKTTLACQIAMHASLENLVPTCVFSLEMSAQALVTRLLCCEARVNARQLRRTGELESRDFPKLTMAAGRISGSNLCFEEISDMSVFKLRSTARVLYHAGVRLFVIDYLQLLTAAGASRKPDSRQQEVADISRNIKAMAMELQVPVISLCQLNDDGQLRESRAIGQDADNVLRLRPDEEEFKAGADVLPVDLEILKQRNGPTGRVPLTFMRSLNRFESCAKVSREDLPPTTHKDP